MKVTKILIGMFLISGLIIDVTDLSAQTRPRARMQCEDNFKIVDTDKDGKISVKEFMDFEHKRANAEANFKLRDADKDGFLSLEEFCSQGAKGQGRGRNK